MRAFRMFDGLNTMTRRGVIGTSTPVFGLRPMRSPFERTTKEPNDDSLTVSPRASVADFLEDGFDQLGRFGARQADFLVDGLSKIGAVWSCVSRDPIRRDLDIASVPELSDDTERALGIDKVNVHQTNAL